VVLREGVEDDAGNPTRFVWLAPAGTMPQGCGRWKTTLTFSELGADHPGALVEALTEFSSRAVNLTRIESRPLRQGLGRYMFFVDLEGGYRDDPVVASIEALRGKAENVRILGSYPVETSGIPGL
jgi:prephenate dehydratase